MGLSIHLLGSPRIERGGRPVDAARGHKAWGLLAYLVRSRIPPSRERLAGLLFPEADDPLRALRWTLVELRRQLGGDAELGGNPLRLTPPHRFEPGRAAFRSALRRPCPGGTGILPSGLSTSLL